MHGLLASQPEVHDSRGEALDPPSAATRAEGDVRGKAKRGDGAPEPNLRHGLHQEKGEAVLHL